MTAFLLACIGGYLAGSVPFALLLARRVGIDVRTAGSGNVGAANVLRTTGPWRGLSVMALDVTKGALAVVLAQVTAGAAVAVMAGGAAIVGHIYPVWLRFVGGKGVACAAGVFLALAPAATAVAAAVFLLTAWMTRYVSLASTTATLSLPPAALLLGAPVPVVCAAAGTAALILFRHRANFRRLLAGTERRMGVGA